MTPQYRDFLAKLQAETDAPSNPARPGLSVGTYHSSVKAGQLQGHVRTQSCGNRMQRAVITPAGRSALAKELVS